MPRKVVRDIYKKTATTIKIIDQDLIKAPKKKKHLLDLSIKKPVNNIETNSPILHDLTKKNSNHFSEKQKVAFIEVSTLQKPRFIEIIRLATAGFIIVFLLNIINVFERGITAKDQVVSAAFSGYSKLLSGGEEAIKTDFNNAADSFSNASLDFENALNTIKFLQTREGIFFSEEKTVKSAEGILKAGRNLAEAGKDFAKGIENLQKLGTLFLETNIKSATEGRESLTEKLQQDLEFLNKANEEIQLARQNLSMVEENILPENIKPYLKFLNEKLNELKVLLEDTEQKIPLILKLLGDRYQHSYLVLLQNDTEVRPTGGFIGSFMLVDVNDGYIVKSEFHDVYEFDGQLTEEIPSPEDIAKVSKGWGLRDSNYSPDFAISAEKAAWFLQKEKGPSVDSVIAINQSFIKNLFDITGPVAVEGLNGALTKENYALVLSYIIESKLSGVEDPKNILRKVIPAFQKELFTDNSLDNILIKILDGLKNSGIILYSRDSEIQQFFIDLGFAGKVINTNPNEDYLNVIATSIGGNKSDLFITQNVKNNTLIEKDGTIINEVKISRKHNYSSESLSEIRNILKPFGFSNIEDHVKFILGAGNNKAVIKVYVPFGSELIHNEGIEEVLIREDLEINKTYFMFEMNVRAGTEQQVSLTYKLPEKLAFFPVDTYKFFAQDQAGLQTSNFQKLIFLNPVLNLYKNYPENLNKDQYGNLNLQTNLEKDLYMSALVGK